MPGMACVSVVTDGWMEEGRVGAKRLELQSVYACVCLFAPDRCWCCVAVITATMIAVFAVSHFSTSGEASAV
ncbi:hypothetical protein EYF80_052741 [Liparis tanakae]|uniref:Uncharacterized protein n=1 Tax=Liparis tanakae TaxID=230148 RepID=A0A4Z2F879_9TELE|nr:hypothetical protein EYF80_052741 [Liparis tanakae]